MLQEALLGCKKKQKEKNGNPRKLVSKLRHDKENSADAKHDLEKTKAALRTTMAI